MIWERFRVAMTLLRLLVLSCLTVLPGAVDARSNIYASGCTGQQLQLACEPYHLIAIKRVFYGVKRNWDCIPNKNVAWSGGDQNNRMISANSSTSDCCRGTHIDCHMDGDSMYPTLNTKCSGYTSCQLEVQKVVTREPCRYKSYSDYMTIVYDCISTGDIASFCSNDVKRGKSLYLANREYPSSIKPKPEGDECQCIIRTAHPQGIAIHTIDVLLAWSDIGPMECRRSLKIQDPMPYQKDIQCAHRGFYGFKSIYSRPVSNVTVTLSSQPGDGMAFVWLQVKPNDADGTVEVICGQPLQELLNRLRQQSESRQRENSSKSDKDKSEDENVDVDVGKKTNGTNIVMRTGPHTMNSDLAAIVGGIVVAGFLLIAMVIIAMALHCRRVRKEKRQAKPLELYPAGNSEPLDLSSYCRYDYDDDHVCSISRSPMKMISLADDDSMAHTFRPNGFTTIARAEECHVPRDITPSPTLPPGISTPPPSAQNQPLLAGRSYREVHYPGDMSLRFVKPLINNMTPTTVDVEPYDHYISQGHTTLPANRKAVLISCGPKSPLGKRSKSVTFSQPVAMVTPLNSESEESMEKPQMTVDVDAEDQMYDNLTKLDIPDYPINMTKLDIPDYPTMSGKPEFIAIPRWDKEYKEDNPVRPLSTFQNSPSPPPEGKSCITPPYDLKFNFENDDTFQPSWSPSRQTGKPLVMPKPQKAELFESGV